MRIAVLGGGIIGRTAAYALQQAGHEVTIVTDRKPEETVSAVAGAVWKPVYAQPIDKLTHWANITYDWLQTIPTHSDGGTGLQFVDAWLHETPQNKNFKWATKLPDFRPVVTPLRLPMEITSTYRATIPVIDMPKFLAWLATESAWIGVKEVHQTVNSVKELQAYGELAIVATGLRTRELIRDSGVYPIQGQIVRVANPGNMAYHSFVNEDSTLYIIPRIDDVVIGGTAVPHDENIKVDRVLQRKILKRAVAFAPELAGQEILSSEVGLRPARDEVLVERRGAIIHAYGHGGSGVTTCWGTALEILKLVENSN